jgi:hypothetical protein
MAESETAAREIEKDFVAEERVPRFMDEVWVPKLVHWRHHVKESCGHSNPVVPTPINRRKIPDCNEKGDSVVGRFCQIFGH